MRGFSEERTDKNAGIISSSNRRLEQHVSSKRVIKDNGVTHSVKYDKMVLSTNDVADKWQHTRPSRPQR